MMKKWLDRHISVDWKTPGAEFLGLFAEFYPELTFLSDGAFEALVDELANASPDECFDPLATHLDLHGYTLWNLDPDSDTYLLAVVPRAKADKVVAHWCGPAGVLEAGSIPVRLGPLRIIQPPVKRKRKAAPELVEDLISFDDLAPSLTSRGDLDVVYRSNGEGDRPTPTLWNVAEWPPREVLAPKVLKDISARGLRFPIYGRADEHWWCRQAVHSKEAAGGTQIVRFDSFEPYRLEVVHEVGDSRSPVECLVQGHGRCVFLLAAEAGQGGRYRLKRYPGGPVAAAPEDIWFDSAEPFSFLVLGPDSVLIYGRERGPLWLSSAGKSRVLDLPHDIEEEMPPFAISAHEFVYFTRDERANPEDGRFTEERLRMHRVDLRQGQRRSALLEDLVTDQRVDFVGAGKIRFRTFHGHLRICRGHGSWQVLNFISRQLGKKDHAWLWNTETDEVLRFGPELFPRLEPRFAYLSSAGRYVAETSYKLRLLVEFNALRPHLKPVQLNWIGQ